MVASASFTKMPSGTMFCMTHRCARRTAFSISPPPPAYGSGQSQPILVTGGTLTPGPGVCGPSGGAIAIGTAASAIAAFQKQYQALSPFDLAQANPNNAGTAIAGGFAPSTYAQMFYPRLQISPLRADESGNRARDQGRHGSKRRLCAQCPDPLSSRRGRQSHWRLPLFRQECRFECHRTHE